MRARVIVTPHCNRRCEGCCNNEFDINSVERVLELDDLLVYEEIVITGGEPMLIPDKVYNMVKTLRDKGYRKKIYLYSAYYHSSLHKSYENILELINGLHFTVHYEATDKEITQLKQLSESPFLNRFYGQTFRLAIDNRLYEKYDFSNINFSNWSVVRKLKWLDNCPLPTGEKLLVYKL